jgi:hypothetical protein
MSRIWLMVATLYGVRHMRARGGRGKRIYPPPRNSRNQTAIQRKRCKRRKRRKRRKGQSLNCGIFRFASVPDRRAPSKIRNFHSVENFFHGVDNFFHAVENSAKKFPCRGSSGFYRRTVRLFSISDPFISPSTPRSPRRLWPPPRPWRLRVRIGVCVSLAPLAPFALNGSEDLDAFAFALSGG